MLQLETPPKHLYKYRDCNEIGFDILLNNQIYFSALEDLNDPFECRFAMESNREDGVDEQWLQALLALDSQYSRWIDDHPEKFEEAIFDRLLRSFTFCCLSEKNDDILSFSHYGRCHQGFCIGFDTSFLPFAEAGIVKYSDSPPVINIVNPGEHAGHTILLTKAKMWEYEKEWRMVSFSEPKGCKKFPEEAVTQIILGCRISEENRQKILDIVEQKQHPIEVYASKIEKRRYALSLERIV